MQMGRHVPTRPRTGVVKCCERWLQQVSDEAAPGNVEQVSPLRIQNDAHLVSVNQRPAMRRSSPSRVTNIANILALANGHQLLTIRIYT